MHLPSHDEQELAAKMLAAYGLEATAVTPVQSWNTSVFRIDTARGSYALRLHRVSFRSQARIRGELAFVKHLASCGLAVPIFIPTLSGNVLLELEELGVPVRDGDVRCCDVTTWLEGEVRRRPQDGLDATAAHRLGLTLARIHLASRAFVLPAHAELPRYDAASLLTEASPHDPGPLGAWFGPADLEIVREITRQAQNVFSQLARDEEVGTLHKDFILGNCLWHGSDVRVLDFADCGVGPFLYDLAPMLTNFSDEPAFQDAFVEGYTSLRPLSSNHRQVLPLLQAVRHVSVCLWVIGKMRRGDPAPPLKAHLEARMSEVRNLMLS